MDEPTAARARPMTGDHERARAFRRLADDHLDESYRLASAILGDRTESRDAVHDAFLTAWNKWGHLRDTTKFEPWFQRIVVNTCRNRLKRRSRKIRTERTEVMDAPTTDVHGADPYGQLDDRLRLEALLQRLKPDDQIVLALRYYRDLKVEDVAGILDIPAGTVMSRLHRAQQRLRDLLQASNATER